MKTWLLASLLLIAAGCASVSAPPAASLSATPGAAVVVTADTYRNDQFSLAYPPGWRVITAPAGAPLSVTFAAPDNCPLIVVSSAPIAQLPACADAAALPDQRTVTRDGQTFYIAGSTTAALQDVYAAALDRITRTLALAS